LSAGIAVAVRQISACRVVRTLRYGLLAVTFLWAGALPSGATGRNFETETPSERIETSALHSEAHATWRRPSTFGYAAPLVAEPLSLLAGAASPKLMHASLGLRFSSGAVAPMRC
jgi:hypothetical protein